jgi:hypothetical protein
MYIYIILLRNNYFNYLNQPDMHNNNDGRIRIAHLIIVVVKKKKKEEEESRQISKLACFTCTGG